MADEPALNDDFVDLLRAFDDDDRAARERRDVEARASTSLPLTA